MSDDRREPRGRGRFGSMDKRNDYPPLRRPLAEESVQVQKQKFELSPMAAEFIPRCHTSVPEPCAEPSYVPQELNGENEDLSVSHVRTIIYEIIVNPGEFDHFSTTLVEALTSTIKNIHSLIAVVHEIVEHAIIDMAFSYNGARLCNYLSKNLSVKFGDSTFRTILLAKCQEEYVERKSYVWDPNLCTRLCGFIMFIGELFIHLEIEISGRSSKVAILGSIIPSLLETLLTNPTKDNIKCVCQFLKFTGGDLEDFNASQNDGVPVNIDKIFQNMTSLSEDATVDRNSRILLNNLIELRGRKWDRLHTSASVNEESTTVSEIRVNEPVLYGPDGLPISTEEVNFLESNLCSNENGSVDDGCSDLDYYSSAQNPGMWSTNEDIDDEMAEEFEKFLLENS